MRLSIYKRFCITSFCLLLTACASTPQPSPSYTNFRCLNGQDYLGKVVGNGHCVALIRECSGAPHTSLWRPSIAVKGNKIPPGSIIANFRNGRYPNRSGWHAAIYISQNKEGIWVWDQWVGKPVHKRLIRFKGGRGKASNDGDRYSLVKFIQ